MGLAPEGFLGLATLAFLATVFLTVFFLGAFVLTVFLTPRALAALVVVFFLAATLADGIFRLKKKLG